MEEILKTIETEVTRLSVLKLRATAIQDKEYKRYLDGQLNALNFIYIEAWNLQQNAAQNAKTH